MAYTVNKTDGTVFASVADGAIDSTSSLTLIGRNTTNYGEYLAENTIKQLENFAHKCSVNATYRANLVQ